MSTIPPELRYTASHEWVRLGADGLLTIGITDYAQASLGDITFVQLPRVGAKLAAGAVYGVVESVKAASDLYCPVGGEVVEANATLDQSPDLVNREPYTGGWMMKLRPVDPAALGGLMDAAAYQSTLS
jgi:glycine cleavage system H protein